eukprot:474715-Amorphochlora_amoeboformis.AAC.1
MEFVSSGNNIALKSTQALISDHDQDKIKVNSPNSLRFPNNPDKDPFFKPSAMDVKDEDRDGLLYVVGHETSVFVQEDRRSSEKAPTADEKYKELQEARL